MLKRWAMSATAVMLSLLVGCGGGTGTSGTTDNAVTAGPAISTTQGETTTGPLTTGKALGSTPKAASSAPVAAITAPASVTAQQAGYTASVPLQAGCRYAWTVTNGTIMVGQASESIAFAAGASGTVGLTCRVTSSSNSTTTGTLAVAIKAATPPAYNITQCLSTQAQSTTLAFSGFGMMTGNLGAQSFFPPGKVADYWGFQSLRDNDPDGMGHNTSFLTRVSCNMLYIMNDTQIATLKTLATNQVDNIRLYAWKRYPLMQSFRRLMQGRLPTGTSGLGLSALKAASRELYLLDGQLSFERAVVYAGIMRSLTADQKSSIAAMVGKGFNSWPARGVEDVKAKTQGLTQEQAVALMTYAGDLYAWYAGSVTADVYFCPERHGTYFGSFYIKDAPAVGNPGYSISQTLTGTVGKALCDSTLGYITPAGAVKVNALVTTQRSNLFGNTTSNIVLARTTISQALRRLISSTEPSATTLSQVKATVASWSGTYGDLDGENNYNYATTFAQVYNNVGGTYLTPAQKTALAALRTKIMTVTYPDGRTIDFSTCTSTYLYAAEVPSTSADLARYTSDAITNGLFK